MAVVPATRADHVLLLKRDFRAIILVVRIRKIVVKIYFSYLLVGYLVGAYSKRSSL